MLLKARFANCVRQCVKFSENSIYRHVPDDFIKHYVELVFQVLYY